MPGHCTISIVIPVLDESSSLAQLHREIRQATSELASEVELIFVDDGSRDDSWQQIKQLQAVDPAITAIRFRRNFGKAAALAAGFAEAHGELIFTLDADLQDDPREIPRFLEKMDEGYDVVSGWKKRRHDPWHKTMPSKVFNALVGRLSGVRLHDHNCGFKCYRRECVEEIRLYGEFHRFVPVLAAARGFRIGEIEVNHRPREHGVSKYGWRRFVRGFLDLLTVSFLTSYQNRPQHLLGGLGLIASFAGLVGLTYLAGGWCLRELGVIEFGSIGPRPLLTFSATSLVVGAQLLSLGLIAELITSRNFDQRSVFSVAERRPRLSTSRETVPELVNE